MDFFQAIILGIVEGITEFLPVSSTGHLILTATILGIPETEFVKSFEIFIQLGAMLAIVVLYFQKYFQNMKVWKNVLVAFIPTAIIGLTLYKVVKEVLLGNPAITVWALFIGGIILIAVEMMHKEKDSHTAKIEDLTLKQSALIGLVQAVSIIPGTSRSAATIIGAMLLGSKRKAAVEFSFLLAVPTLLAASGLDLVKTKFHFSGSEWMLLLTGFVVSFIVALVVVKWFLNYVQKNNLIPFGIYRIVVAILFWVLILR
jgi:undecaprenyl-diphosphatase